MKTIEDGVSPQTLLDFFTEMVETSKPLMRYYLSDNVVLDWFGQTIKGQKNVATFIRYNINPIKHMLKDVKPTSKIGFRDSHIVKISRPLRRTLRSAFLSPPRLSMPCTPKKMPFQASTSLARRETLRRNINDHHFTGINDDTDHNKTPTNGSGIPSERGDESPRKRRRHSPRDLDADLVEPECDFDLSDVAVRYLTAEGDVEFHRPSLKKLQTETKWRRPCKFHLAYDCGKDVKDSTFYLIIYEGNVKCRKNLMSAFEAEEPEC
ncbi:hypothetical protein GWI33_005080 [Rhynchophorus ferrugineus]|uniref:Uncharacterized protein n=1 Tax=Rhynchophorus ferrugineus TaxID=354439 RepID=A0A834MEW6_RHYFE|nr:hypothetical protein GWI33_005080 [Rhynchophorus ferrugineus]